MTVSKCGSFKELNSAAAWSLRLWSIVNRSLTSSIWRGPIAILQNRTSWCIARRRAHSTYGGAAKKIRLKRRWQTLLIEIMSVMFMCSWVNQIPVVTVIEGEIPWHGETVFSGLRYLLLICQVVTFSCVQLVKSAVVICTRAASSTKPVPCRWITF